MKRHDRGQIDEDEVQSKVLDDCSHVTSVLGTFRSKDYVIILNLIL